MLGKIILISIIIAAMTIPARAAKTKDARQGLKKTIVHTLIFNLIYLTLITLVWMRLV